MHAVFGQNFIFENEQDSGVEHTVLKTNCLLWDMRRQLLIYHYIFLLKSANFIRTTWLDDYSKLYPIIHSMKWRVWTIFEPKRHKLHLALEYLDCLRDHKNHINLYLRTQFWIAFQLKALFLFWGKFSTLEDSYGTLLRLSDEE